MIQFVACSRRQIGGRGVLDFFDLAFLAATLQGHFFFVDGHGIGVRLFAAAGALVMKCQWKFSYPKGLNSRLTLLSRLLDMLASDSLRLRTLPGRLPTASSSP